MDKTIKNPDIKPRKRKALRAGENRPRLTVQLSSELLDAIQTRADEEAIPVAVFVRRAVTRLVSEVDQTGIVSRREVSGFGESRRKGRRGPMRQWPKGVSYVVDAHIADRIKQISDDEGTNVSALAREAIVRDLDRQNTVRRVLLQDEIGFTTSGAPQRGRAAQKTMDEAWRSTNE